MDDTWRLVKVSSSTSDSSFSLSLALLSGESVAGQTEVVHRAGARGWSPSGYSWTLSHAPSSASLALTLEDEGGVVWAQQWQDFTGTPQRGRVGVYTHSQPAAFHNLMIQEMSCL